MAKIRYINTPLDVEQPVQHVEHRVQLGDKCLRCEELEERARLLRIEIAKAKAGLASLRSDPAAMRAYKRDDMRKRRAAKSKS